MLNFKRAALPVLLFLSPILGAPIAPYSGWPVPGESHLYNTYYGKARPFPANNTTPILLASTGAPAPDDQHFQNLLAAEDNEAGHLNIFYRSISEASVKPGPCKYDYGFKTAEQFLGLRLEIEIGSLAFLSGLEYQAKEKANRAALLAISDVETRHATWALTDVWNTDPFSGPSDTVYPYANQILQITNRFVVSGSCPAENPQYASPDQHLLTLSFNISIGTGHPGSRIEFLFPDARHDFEASKDYYAVFFHGLYNISVAFDPDCPTSTIPALFDPSAGSNIVAIADTLGATSAESVVAGPLILLE